MTKKKHKRISYESAGKKKFIISDKHAQKIINKVMKNNFLLVIKTHAWGNRKAISKSLLNEKFEDNAEAVSAVQRLIDKNEVKKVTQPIGRVINFIRSKSFPWLTDGIYSVIEKDIMVIEEELQKARTELKERKEKFKIKFPELKENYKKNYPELYNESYYPSLREIDEKFDLVWYWQKISPPIPENSDISIISQDMANFENKKFQEMIKGVAEETITAMRASFLKMITRMHERLSDPEATFRNSTIEKPIKFLEELKDINIYDDKPFANIAKDISDALDGISVDDLREDKQYRKEIGNQMEKIVTQFEELPEVKFKRALEF